MMMGTMEMTMAVAWMVNDVVVLDDEICPALMEFADDAVDWLMVVIIMYDSVRRFASRT